MASKTKTGASTQLDAIERQIVKLLVGHVCMRCHTFDDSSQGVQWCHIIRRAHKSLRWDRRNHLVLCTVCHYWFDNKATDRQRTDFVESVRPGTYDYLESVDPSGWPRNEALFDMSLAEMNELIIARRTELKELKRG